MMGRNRPARAIIDRFEEKYIPEPNSGCWLWCASLGSTGYGQFVEDTSGPRRPEKAHRTSWRLYRGGIPEGQQVLHRCDNSYCVNPDHLFLGTPADNMLDAASKNRMPSATNGRHHGLKLSVSDVEEIRKSPQSPDVLAWRFGVALSTIYGILNGTNRRKG